MNIGALSSAISSSSFGLSMGAIWQHLSVELTSFKISDEEKAGVFLEVLARLMLGGHVKLALDGKFLTGGIDEQIDLIKLAWPACPRDDDLDGVGLWFLTTAPAGVVWVTTDGQQVWT